MLPYIHDVRAAAERLFASPRATHYASRDSHLRSPAVRRVNALAFDATLQTPSPRARSASPASPSAWGESCGPGVAKPRRCARHAVVLGLWPLARGFPRARAAQSAGDNAFRSIAAALQPMSLAPLRSELFARELALGFLLGGKVRAPWRLTLSQGLASPEAARC